MGATTDPTARTTQRAPIAGPGHVSFGDEAVAATGASHAAVVAARTLAATAAESLTDDECLGVFDQMELARRSLAAAAAGVLGEIEARGLCDRRYGSTTRVWFERRHGRSRASVGRDVRTAGKLRCTLPGLAAALARGEITAERVDLVASKVNGRNAAAMAAAQEALLALSAAEPSFSRFAALVDDLARHADPDGGHDPAEPTNRASVHRTGGELSLDATYVDADGESFEQMLEAATNRLWREWRRDAERCPELEVPSRARLRAQALLELVRRGLGSHPATATSTAPELSLVIDADRVDDLDPILAAALDGAGVARTNPFARHSEAVPGSCCASTGAGPPATMPVSGPSGSRVWFTAQQWELLVCNAEISEILLDRFGMPRAVRDRLRRPTRSMRRALVVRDGGCAFPGCDCPSGWCDAHHVIEWSDDGPTVIVNLVLLCRRHHGVVHRSGWNVRLNDDVVIDDDGQVVRGPASGEGFFTITTPGGLELQTQHRVRVGGPSGREPAPA